MLDTIRLKIHKFLIRLVHLIHPGYMSAPITPGRLQRLQDLLWETGHEERLAQHTARPAGPVDSTQVAKDIKSKQNAQEFAEELHMKFMKNGRLQELADIVLYVKPFQNVDDIPAGVIVQGLAVFIRGYALTMRKLLGTRKRAGSTPAVAQTTAASGAQASASKRSPLQK